MNQVVTKAVLMSAMSFILGPARAAFVKDLQKPILEFRESTALLLKFFIYLFELTGEPGPLPDEPKLSLLESLTPLWADGNPT